MTPKQRTKTSGTDVEVRPNDCSWTFAIVYDVNNAYTGTPTVRLEMTGDTWPVVTGGQGRPRVTSVSYN